jgi:predicted transport protein
MNKTFANFARSIRPDRYLESIEACFQLLPSYRRFPKDDEFQRELLARDLYNFRNRSYWLRRLENHDRKERVAVDEYTIEHILPQNPDLSPSWQQALGPDWSKVQERWLHTIGNLTLTGYNPEYGDRPFNEKRDMKGGFAESPLRLNAGLGQLATWDEAAIKSRGARLAKTALAVWRAPRLDDLVLGTYQQPTRDSTIATYSIEDHPHLVSSPASALFNRLREEILRLDACVTEEFLKFYVAYKAETNIVDVYPQKQKLRLILNMQFQEIRDDRGICKDMSGNKLNGEVEVHLKSIDDLPYIMGLIRQSFASQMPEGPQG